MRCGSSRSSMERRWVRHVSIWCGLVRRLGKEMSMTDDRRTFLKGIGMMSALVAAGCAAPSRRSGARGRTMKLDAMHQRLAAYVDRGDLPGYVALVARDDEVQVDLAGMTARGGSVAVRRDT